MNNKVEKLFNVDFFYLLFIFGMVPLIIISRCILDFLYFLMITFYYIKFKLYEKKII